MKRRYVAVLIAAMVAGSLFTGCGSAGRDKAASDEKYINETQTTTKAVADASDSSANQADAGQAEESEDNNNQEDSQNNGYQDDTYQDAYWDNGYENNGGSDNGSGSDSDDNGGSSDAGENPDDSSTGGNVDISNDESLLASARVNTVTYSEFANRVLELVNIERANAGVSPLVLDEALCNAANMRAIEMDRTREFSHTRPDGGSCFDVYDICNVEWQFTCGENIAAGLSTPEDVMRAWMDSKGHKANILNPEFTKMGLGYSEGVYWAQEFAG